MAKFKVISIASGREVSSEKINKIAKTYGLTNKDIDQFFIGEDGQLVMADKYDNNIIYLNRIVCHNTKGLGLMPVFEGKYPDLEYFETILPRYLREFYPEAFKTSSWQPQIELVNMFPQTWPDTAGGFSEPGTVAGQAFTTQFTTVMRAHVYDTDEEYYGVFFGNKPAYIVDNANEIFFEDLRNQRLKSTYEAKKAY